MQADAPPAPDAGGTEVIEATALPAELQSADEDPQALGDEVFEEFIARLPALAAAAHPLVPVPRILFPSTTPTSCSHHPLPMPHHKPPSRTPPCSRTTHSVPIHNAYFMLAPPTSHAAPQASQPHVCTEGLDIQPGENFAAL